MILIYVAIILIVVAWLMSKDLAAISKLPFQGGRPVLVLVAILFILQAVAVIYTPGQTKFQIIILVLSQVVLVGILLLNHHLPGAKLFALGVALNITVMTANGGWMPIPIETYSYIYPDRPPIEAQARPPNSKNVALDREDINLWWLSDVVPVPWLWRWYAVSPGDIVLMFGVALFIFAIPKKTDKNPGPG